MKKILVVGLAVLLSVGVAFADNDKTEPGSGINPNGFFDKPGFDNGNAWWKGTPGTPDPNPCPNGDCSASGNFNFNVFTIGGGIDGALRLHGGVLTGGLAAGGGIAAGEGSGQVQTGKIYGWIGPKWYNFGWKTINLGSTEGYLSTFPTGGMAKVSPIDNNGYVGTLSESIAVTALSGGVKVLGIAGAEVYGFGLAGQGNAAFAGTLIPVGYTYGVAGQGSVGYLMGGAVAVGLGSADFQGLINMYGNSYAASMKDIYVNSEGFLVKTIGSQAGALTQIDSTYMVKDSGLAVGYLTGGYQFAGAAKSDSFQITQGGVTHATSNGSYAGGGVLGCDTGGQVDTYAGTTTMTKPGWNGSINGASASASVKVGPSPTIQTAK